MEEEPPIRITVFDKNYNRKGYVTSPNSVSILLAWNAPGTTTFEVSASHSRVNDLVTEGSRCVVEYRPPGKAWMTVMSGVVSERHGSGGPEAPVREFEVLDDLDVVNHIIDYPVPDQPASNQSASKHDVRSGPIETVFKGFASANIAGQGIPKLTVQASAGLGASVTNVRHRMRNLGDHMLDAGNRYGIGWRVVQTGATRQLQAWVPPTYPRVLTEESGAVVAAEFSITPPEVTRITVGIGGEGTARQFYGPPTTGFVDTTAEALWGLVRHEFLDARDVEQADPNRATVALERANERLLEGAAKASLKAELSETGFFKFGVAFNLGDQVSVKPSGSAVITDRVREVEITWDADGGLLVTPRVGEWTDDSASSAHWKATRTALRRVNELGTR